MFQDVDWDKMWSPRIVFTNAEEIKKIECKHRIKPADDEHGEPDVYFTYRLRATFKTSMYLKTFPVDFQVRVVPATPLLKLFAFNAQPTHTKSNLTIIASFFVCCVMYRYINPVHLS